MNLVILLLVGLLSSICKAVESESDPLSWLRSSIPGEPGVDYPILSEPADTSFSCSDKIFGGYYADPEQQCQVFHVCLQTTKDDLAAASFLCPNGTVFNQAKFICDWWFNVDCLASESLYQNVEGAFGGGDLGEGQCPAPGGGQNCANAVSTCWSPGQRDIDCPQSGLCCFDGCANTCLTGSKPVSRPQPTPSSRPRPQPTLSSRPQPTPSSRPRPQSTPSSRPRPQPTRSSSPRPQPTPTVRPRPQTTPRPQPVVFEDDQIDPIITARPVVPTRRPTTPPKTSRTKTAPPATTYRPFFTTPKTTSLPGYSYETPDPGLPSLYGPPDQDRRGRSRSSGGRKF